MDSVDALVPHSAAAGTTSGIPWRFEPRLWVIGGLQVLIQLADLIQEIVEAAGIEPGPKKRESPKREKSRK